MADHIKKRSRPNTRQEKQKMKKERRRRKTKMNKCVMLEKIKLEEDKRLAAEKDVVRYKSMSRCYWERWQWELKQHKEELKKKNLLVAGGSELLQVDISQLQNPSGMENDVYIGRGSFGVIRLQVFRGIYVANYCHIHY